MKKATWKELNGRTLTIQSSETSEGVSVIGTDVETKEIFVISSQLNEEI